MLKKLQIFFLKLIVNTFGQASTGMRIVKKEALISGHMVDYVYKNKPSGSSRIGVWIDSVFLSNPGWETVRIRRKNLVTLIKKALEITLLEKGRVYLCDVASGPASYIFEALVNFKSEKIFVLLRDIDQRCLEEARKKSVIAGVGNIEFQIADALEPKDFKFKSPPNIFVSSGFYDWFSDDNKIKTSMRLIFDSLPSGGFFVFTAQTGHVDLKLINGVFKSFDKTSLDMKVRPIEHFKSWAQDTGFIINEVLTDKLGHYSVVLAQKRR